MSRKIKFRAWEPVNKEMHYMDFALHDGDKYASKAANVLRVRTMNLDALNVMQFTGWYDKNNRDIYEGDIIKLTGAESGEILVHVDDITCLPLSSLYPAGEVVGNIYENADLLGDQHG